MLVDLEAKKQLKKNLKEILCNFLEPTLQYLKKIKYFFDHENMKKPPSKVPHNRPQIFFLSIDNRPKVRQILHFFHKNGSLRNFYIMNLVKIAQILDSDLSQDFIRIELCTG